MNNQSRIVLCLLFTVFLLTPVLAYGQEDVDEPNPSRADIPHKGPGKEQLLIINGSRATKVNFSVKNGDSDWVDFSLDPLKDVFFSHTTEIRIATDNGKTVEYSLAYNNRYRIFWNAVEERWDVTRLVPR
jgi:hypothetical protein